MAGLSLASRMVTLMIARKKADAACESEPALGAM
jgi:hypothetical protein